MPSHTHTSRRATNGSPHAKKHLEHEKELSRRHDRMTAERRRLPMVLYGTDFNYDFHVTLDESITPIAYN